MLVGFWTKSYLFFANRTCLTVYGVPIYQYFSPLNSCKYVIKFEDFIHSLVRTTSPSCNFEKCQPFCRFGMFCSLMWKFKFNYIGMLKVTVENKNLTVLKQNQ